MPGTASARARRRLLFLHTGGTLSMVRRSHPGPLEPDHYDRHVLPYVRGLEDLADIEACLVCAIDSSDMSPALWERIAAEVARGRERYDGFVVLHGTDTMAYTAAALSYMLRGLDRPVVLTGSQRPIAELRTDARANLVHSAMCATLDLPEVGLFFGDRLFRGNRASKVSIQAYDAFASPNFPPLLRVGVDVVPEAPALRQPGPFQLQAGFRPDVAVLHLVPGQDPRALHALVDTGARAVLLLGFGEGNLPASRWPQAIAEVSARGVAVIVLSQCRSGSAVAGRYQGSAAARDAGAIYGLDHTVEAAVVKAMWLLGQGLDRQGLADRFPCPIAGECTPAPA
ncbi:asparaginase [Myxococcota bacterium]|nr:asparaginase [Myxococcota bacterium]